MSVTDKGSAHAARTASRNARRAALVPEAERELARRAARLERARREGLSGTVLGLMEFAAQKSVDSVAEQLLVDGAIEHARWCGACGRDLAPGDAVYRRRAF